MSSTATLSYSVEQARDDLPGKEHLAFTTEDTDVRVHRLPELTP
jgi:hypothetical protein